MPSEVAGEFVDVPRPVAILLESAYVVLLALGFLASIFTAACLLWQFLGNGRPLAPSFLFARASSEEERYKDGESCEERAGLEVGDDTDEEYMRRPY